MSENRDGGLAFKATLDIDDFNVSAEAMERRIRNASTNIGYEAERMDNSILNFARNGAKYIATYLVANGLTQLGNNIVQVRGQFQQLEIAFDTMLGSASKSQALMNQMIETAAKTPFDLKGVAGGAKQLLAYGFAADEVNDTLIRLGNIASGLSIPLSDMVYLYGTTMTQGRLYAQDMRQFMGRGIPLAKELASMYGKSTEEINAMVSAGKVGFADVEKVMLKLTNSGGQFFNLMEKQSKSLTGMLTNLNDALDVELNRLGEKNQEAFAKGIEGATYMVEHLEDILRILKSVAIGYGSYKAAIVANTIATKGLTGVALIDNTVKQIKLSMMREEAKLSGQTTIETKKLTAAQIAQTQAMEAQLSATERQNIASRLRIATIQQMLTAQQQQYLSTLGLTASSSGYEAAAMQILTVEQKESLSKLDLTSKSSIYRAAIEQEILSKKRSKDATLDGLRAEVKASYSRVEAAKQAAALTIQRSEMARLNLQIAKESGDVTKISIAEKKLEGAVENQAIARKAALAASSDFHTKKKQLETAATAASASATAADSVAKGVATTSTNIFTLATGKLTIAMKTLWASMKTNPIGWVLTLVGLAISAFTMFKGKTDEQNDAMGEFSETTRKEVDNLNMLISVLKNTESGTKAHKSALEKVNTILKDYNKELIDEQTTVDELNKKYKELTDAINESASARVKAKYIEQYQKDQSAEVTEATKTLKKKGGTLKDYEYDEVTGSGYWRAIKPIQDMNQAIYDMIELQAVESANNLKDLTGDAYTKAFSETVNRIADQVQEASGASDKDMAAFTVNIESYLYNVTQSMIELDTKTNTLNQSMNKFTGNGGGKPASADSVDYLSMSLSDLDKIVKDTEKEINDINSKEISIDTDNKKLNELMGILQNVKGVISDKELNLNTESGIEARIKQLKDERSDVEINSKKYNELSATIDKLGKKLPTKKGNDSEIQLTEKQIQSQMRLEQANIEIMEDGHKKRRAMLDLQHKQNLLAIDKEEKELIKAKKDAGKGGLTAEEKTTFDSRRDVEDKAYLKAQNRVFDAEVSYKKEQYALYWRWVENMGKDVAGKRFSELLKDGSSYKDYLEKQIAQMKEKQASGQITEGESNLLISMNSELNEINGVKSAMDLFKESMTQAIREASTLAEKVRVVAEYKDRLESGKTGIISNDQQAEANLFVNNQEDENDKEIRERLLNDFRTFEERKNAIVTEHNLLRIQKQVQGNAELLNMINRGEAEALSAINAEILMQSQSWKDLFMNLDILSASQIEALISNINNQLQDSDMKLTPVDYAALMESLGKAKDKVVSLNPFRALGTAFDGYIEALKKLKQAERDNLSPEELAKKKKDVQSAAEQMVQSITEITDVVGVVGDSVGSIADAFGTSDTTAADIEAITGALVGTGQAAGGVAKIMAGDVVGGIKDVVTGLTSVITNMTRLSDNKREKEIQSLQKNIDKLKKSYEELGDQIDRAYGKDKADILEAQNKSLEAQNRAIEKQIRAEEAKKKTDKQKIKDWEEEIAENEKEIAENRKYNIIEAIIGTDIKSAIDQLADAYADAWSKGEKAAGKSANVVKDLIKNSIIETLKGKLKPEVEAFMTFLADALQDGVITAAEQNMINDWEKRLETMTDKELSGKEKWLKGDDEEVSKDPLTGAIRGMSEDTGSLIAGKFNAFIINQSETNKTLIESLLYQREIAENTRYNKYLKSIDDRLGRIEAKDNNTLLSQGIGG